MPIVTRKQVTSAHFRLQELYAIRGSGYVQPEHIDYVDMLIQETEQALGFKK